MATNTFAPGLDATQGKSIEPLPKGSTIAVIGAGAFGGWASLFLLRNLYKVILIDAWGPGNSRSSSGDETRVIRSTYGANEFYFDLNVRALQLWKEHEERWKKSLFINKGVLWMCYEAHTPLVDDSMPYAHKHKTEYLKLTNKELHDRFKILNTDDLSHAYLDPFGGCLNARVSCQAVHQAFIEEGGAYVQDYVQPGLINNGRLTELKLLNGNTIKADAYLFACGSWLGRLFPDVLSNFITCTKQEVYYFGVPHKEATLYEEFPVWIDADGKDFYYGIPGNSFRGFKIGVDKRGEAFDPTDGDRTINEQVLQDARKFITHRFPGLANSPLIENRVCPYENSPDGNFLFDHHPEAKNVFFLGGGSGHGFKHGPSLGELVMNCLKGTSKIPGHFLLK
jgi:glycine/D-amino acid oxidase-like deaminating enzyme